AAHPYEILSPSTRSFRDFFINRGNVHAICFGHVARRWRVSDARDRLGTRVFRRHHESDTRRAASSKTCDDSLPWNGLDRTHAHTSARAGNSVVGAPLVDCGWHRYTAGTLFFANERLRYGHFVWHLFVLAGTSCHFAAVFICAI